uniref:Cytochrome c oxidase polypeptide VIa n=1 Tax=Arion vulgaris TaxID=1028688 RepID=A0A0B7BTS5_9EUPU
MHCVRAKKKKFVIILFDYLSPSKDKMASRLSRLNVALQVCKRFYSAQAAEAHGGGHGESYKTWRNAFFILGVPAVVAVYYNAYYVMPQHPERPEFVPYAHLHLRGRKFPWGDGNHSLFHNPYYNAIPEGYDEGSEELHPGKHHHH